MVDVLAMPDNAFGYVPTPAIVGPIEFTLSLQDYADLGGHMAFVRSYEDIHAGAELISGVTVADWRDDNPWPFTSGPFASGSAR